MQVSPLVWLLSFIVLVAVLVFDLVVIGRKPHTPSMRECSLAILIYSISAMVFGVWVGFSYNWSYATEFFAGWLTEYSLSVDNLFIFVLIMANLKVPKQLQQYALMVGIVLALIFRGIFIALGAAMIENWAWIFFIFGFFLVWTAFQLTKDFLEEDQEEEATDNAIIRWAKKTLPSVPDFAGTKMFVRQNGKRFITPMFFVILALGSTDVLFALDSIPAIYGLTQEAYLVFTANVFALMGLRQLYFLIGGLLKRLVYLSLGLSVILAFIGIKLILHAMHHYHLAQAIGINGEIPTWFSLVFLIVVLVITAFASILKTKNTTA